jgi:hypothetical protein
VETLYFNVPQSDIRAVLLENAQGVLRFQRAGEQGWTLLGLGEEEELDQEQVDSLLARVSSITLRRPLGTEVEESYGLQDPQAVVTLETEKGTYELRVGAQDPEDDGYVVSSSESEYVVRVPEGNVKDLVEWGREDFLVAEPTGTPTPEAGDLSEPTPEATATP